MAVNTAHAREQAEMYLAKPRFHQTVTIPEGDGHGSLVVSYAEYGCYSSNDNKQDGTLASVGSVGVPTVLFMPGMFASRYTGVSMHAIAEKLGVRVLVPDRQVPRGRFQTLQRKLTAPPCSFGFGQTPDVALEERVPLWVTIMPKFLDVIGLKHVALASHSAGTIYQLNLLWHCRQVLDPENPMVFFLAPWVDTAHSKTSLGRALQALPVVAIKQWNRVASFLGVHVSGTIRASSGVFSKLANVVSLGRMSESEQDKGLKTIQVDFGIGRAIQAELGNLATKGMFNENTVGANSEAICCLKKGPNGTWGEADDMKALVTKIIERESETRSDGQKKLRVNIYFAKTDMFLGKKGQKYFESCWLGNEGTAGGGVEVKATKTEKGDHDNIIGHGRVLKDVFQLAAGMSTRQNMAEGNEEVVEVSDNAAEASDDTTEASDSSGETSD